MKRGLANRALLLGDIVSRLVSVFLTQNKNIGVVFFFARHSPLDELPKVKAG